MNSKLNVILAGICLSEKVNDHAHFLKLTSSE